jgi:hypothetical protein
MIRKIAQNFLNFRFGIFQITSVLLIISLVCSPLPFQTRKADAQAPSAAGIVFFGPELLALVGSLTIFFDSLCDKGPDEALEDAVKHFAFHTEINYEIAKRTLSVITVHHISPFCPASEISFSGSETGANPFSLSTDFSSPFNSEPNPDNQEMDDLLQKVFQSPLMLAMNSAIQQLFASYGLTSEPNLADSASVAAFDRKFNELLSNTAFANGVSELIRYFDDRISRAIPITIAMRIGDSLAKLGKCLTDPNFWKIFIAGANLIIAPIPYLAVMALILVKNISSKSGSLSVQIFVGGFLVFYILCYRLMYSSGIAGIKASLECFNSNDSPTIDPGIIMLILKSITVSGFYPLALSEYQNVIKTE